ncbi:MAG: glycosyltransferase [Bacteroidetes bacterium]|nr:glycosyltransferase [Bacteroidota bacterium]
MNAQKKVCIAFLGNALHDSRITNLKNSLKNDNCSVSVISFDWFITSQDYRDDEVAVFNLTKGSFSLIFYLQFAFILLYELLKSRADIYFAEDLYTLPFVTVIAKIRNAKIYYNSRELYSCLGGLRNRPRLQALISAIEKVFIKKVDLVITTGEMDSAFLEKLYGIRNTLVIRNIPLLQTATSKVDFRKKYNLPNEMNILLYQGVLLEGRGIVPVLNAMTKIPHVALIILGDGQQKINFQKLAEELKVADRVFFEGTVSQKELINYTAGGDIGLSLIENISVSYYHALPNKMFEYIMAGLPVLASDLPQMKKIIDTYQVGECIKIENEDIIVTTLNDWIDNPDKLETYRVNCAKAAEELNWQKEYERGKTRLLEN